MRSGYEYQIRDDLLARGVDFDYESEVIEYTSAVRGARCIECGAKVMKPRKYTPDFVIVRSDQSKLYVEAKGRFPSTDRSKMRDIRRCNQHLDIRILFQRRSKKEMASLQAWADKNGFDCAFGTEVPSTWLA